METWHCAFAYAELWLLLGTIAGHCIVQYTVTVIRSVRMIKPPQYARSYHICNALNAKPTVQFSTVLLFKCTPHIHLTIHLSVLSNVVKSSQGGFDKFLNPSFSRIFQDTRDTGPVYFSFHFDRSSLKLSLEPDRYTLPTMPRHNALLILMHLLLLYLPLSSFLTNTVSVYAFQLITHTNHYLLQGHNFSIQLPINMHTSYIGNQPHSAVYTRLACTTTPSMTPLYALIVRNTVWTNAFPANSTWLFPCFDSNLALHFTTFVSPKFTLSHCCILFFPFWIISTVSAINYLDKTLSTMTKSNGLSTAPWWTPTLTPNAL